MIFSTEFKDQIRRCVRISDVVSRHVQLTRRGTRMVGLCPFHPEKTPSFYVFDSQDSFHCFGCQAHGDIFTFIQQIQNVDFPTAVELLATQAGLALPDESKADDPHAHKRRTYLEIMEETAQFYEKSLVEDMGKIARDYLEKRSIQPNIQGIFRLGYAPGKTFLKKHLLTKGFSIEDLEVLRLLTQDSGYDFFNNRLMFPITNRQGQVIAFGGRSLDGRDPKYINSADTPIFQKSFHLYGYATSRKSEKRDIPSIICEGYMDVIALYQGGYEKAVAPLGTALTEEQIQLAWRLTPQPIVCFDGDTAGQRAAQGALYRALPHLKPNHSLNFITLPKGEDPDSLLQSGQGKILKGLLQKPMNLVDKLWEGLITNGAPKSPEQQAFLKEQIKEVSQKIEHGDLKKAYAHYLNTKFFELIRGPGKSGNFKSQPPIQLSRRTPMASHLIQEKILLGLALTHPTILLDVNETLGCIDFSRPDFMQLKDLLISYVNDDKELDRQLLHSHLINKGYENVYSLVMDKSLHLHEPALGLEQTDMKAKDAFFIHLDALNQVHRNAEDKMHLKERILSQERKIICE